MLDSDVIVALSSANPARQRVMTERLDDLHREGLVTVITGTVLAQIASTENLRNRKTLVETATARVDKYFPILAIDLVKMELQERDPATAFGELLSLV